MNVVFSGLTMKDIKYTAFNMRALAKVKAIRFKVASSNFENITYTSDDYSGRIFDLALSNQENFIE